MRLSEVFQETAQKTDDPKAIFRALCQLHDTSHDFSDDSRYWERGWAELKVIRQYAADHLTSDEALDIWNAVAREKFPSPEGHRPFIKREWR